MFQLERLRYLNFSIIADFDFEIANQPTARSSGGLKLTIGNYIIIFSLLSKILVNFDENKRICEGEQDKCDQRCCPTSELIPT